MYLSLLLNFLTFLLKIYEYCVNGIDKLTLNTLVAFNFLPIENVLRASIARNFSGCEKLNCSDVTQQKIILAYVAIYGLTETALNNFRDQKNLTICVNGKIICWDSEKKYVVKKIVDDVAVEKSGPVFGFFFI